jgi:ABC-type amino acid transport substrate-binding protein
MAGRVSRYLAAAFAIAWLGAMAVSVQAQTLERIAASKTVRIGYIADQAPFASKDANGQPTGFAIDLCAMVVAGLGAGLNIVYVETDLGDAFAEIAADRIDMLCGAVTATLGRREIVDFSEPTFLTGMSGLLRADAPRDLRELFLGERTVSPPRSPSLRPFATSRIGVRNDTTTEATLRRVIAEGGYGATVLEYETHQEGLAALEAGDIDAYFGDLALLAALYEQAKAPGHLMLASRLVTREPYGIAMKRGDADFRLAVDRILSTLYTLPEFTAMLEKHFGEDALKIGADILAHSVPE